MRAHGELHDPSARRSKPGWRSCKSRRHSRHSHRFHGECPGSWIGHLFEVYGLDGIYNPLTATCVVLTWDLQVGLEQMGISPENGKALRPETASQAWMQGP